VFKDEDIRDTASSPLKAPLIDMEEDASKDNEGAKNRQRRLNFDGEEPASESIDW
jgi:hypothetical protein